MKTIYNNKFTDTDKKLAANLKILLGPLGIIPPDYPLTILSDEDTPPKEFQDECLQGPYDFEMLGYYNCLEAKIVLLRGKIQECANKLQVPEPYLRSIVFIHELGHYYSHLCTLWKTKAWRTHLFAGASTNVKEGWAQLFTAWAVEKDYELGSVFEALLAHQSHPYHVFENYYKNWTTEALLHSLDSLRPIFMPVTEKDWNSFLP